MTQRLVVAPAGVRATESGGRGGGGETDCKVAEELEELHRRNKRGLWGKKRLSRARQSTLEPSCPNNPNVTDTTAASP